MMSSAIVSDVFYVTHEMVAYKTKLNENSNLNQLSNYASVRKIHSIVIENTLICLNVKCDYFIATLRSLLSWKMLK